MHYIEGIDRNQMSFIALEELVDQNSWARLVDVFVESLPLSKLGFTKVDLKEEGRPPFHPAILLKLYMYGYKHGLRSSRKLEHACKVNVELWWLLHGQTPSNRTIAAFRKDNKKAFKNAFRHFVLLLKEWNLIGGDVIAIDSFKIRGQNSLKNNFNQKKIDRHIEYIDNKIAEYENQLDQLDKHEQKTELESKIHDQQNKKEKYKAVEKELKDSEQAQISKTDPDAKAVVLHRNIINVGYNVQAACDEKHKMFIHADTGNVNDTHALAPMAIHCKAILDKDHLSVLADKGYCTGKQLLECTENNITTHVSPKKSSSKNADLYPVTDFKYDEKHDCYTCPSGETLTTNGKHYKHSTRIKAESYFFKRYITSNCRSCKLRSKCTNSKVNGRAIDRSQYAGVIEENKKRVLQNPDYYRKRQQITEHQFGTLKRQWGFTFTLMKRKENVMSEVNLLFTIYNLKRALSVLGHKELKARLKQLKSFFSMYFKANTAHLRPLMISNTEYVT